MSYDRPDEIEIPDDAVTVGPLQFSGGRDPEGRKLLAEAMAKAQGEIVPAKKDRVNDHLGSAYSTLQEVREVARIPLSKNGIALFQAPQINGKHVTVATELVHASGQWCRAELTFATEYMKGLNAMQVVGSAISYARRYLLQAMTGVVVEADPEDDDAEAVRQPDRERRPPAPKVPMPPDFDALIQAIRTSTPEETRELYRMGRHLPFKMTEEQVAIATAEHNKRLAFHRQTAEVPHAPPAAADDKPATKSSKVAEDIANRRQASNKSAKPFNEKCMECETDVYVGGLLVDKDAVKAGHQWMCARCAAAADGGAPRV